MTFQTAYLKIQRAGRHIEEMESLIHERKPFAYILETDINAGYRSTFARKDKSAIEQIALVCGDAVHNLRSALDHAYVELVSPFCSSDRDRRRIQFPFSETAANLDEVIASRLAPKVGTWFVDAIKTLQPHKEAGGNELLYLVHELDIMDKHRNLIPQGDYTRLSSGLIRKQVSDFPLNIINCTFGGNNRDVRWPISPQLRSSLKDRIPPSGILEQELDVPVQIVFATRPLGHAQEFVRTMRRMTDAAKSALEVMIKPVDA